MLARTGSHASMVGQRLPEMRCIVEFNCASTSPVWAERPIIRLYQLSVHLYLQDLPIHPRQHAFQAGKSTESAVHQLVNRTEQALDAGQYALVI